MSKLDAYEREVLGAHEAGQLKPGADKAELQRLQAAARATAIKDTTPSPSLSSREIDLEAVVDRLNRHGQRATYSAVGSVAGLPARSVMHGRPMDRRNSWVVAKVNGLPSGYTHSDMDSRLPASPAPIADGEELRRWLKSHP
jgi:hypothetical protein